jgi:hypothetical protein
MLKSTDNIFAPGRGNSDDFIAVCATHRAQTPYPSYTRASGNLCDAVGIDRMIPWWQAVWETGWFTSSYFVNDGNVGGMGIDVGGMATPFLIDPTAGEDVALVHIATLWAMAQERTSTFDYPAALAKAKHTLCPIWLSHVEYMVTDPNRPTVKTLGDLNIHFRSVITGDMEATWAWDDAYVTGICARANASGMVIPDQSLYSGYVKYSPLKLFHAVQGAVLRVGPSRDTAVTQPLSPNQRFWIRGYAHGQLVAGSDVWLQSSGAHGFWCHSSGVIEKVD